jgi:hypothetical protein
MPPTPNHGIQLPPEIAAKLVQEAHMYSLLFVSPWMGHEVTLNGLPPFKETFPIFVLPILMGGFFISRRC